MKTEKAEAVVVEVNATAKRLDDGVDIQPTAIREGFHRMFQVEGHPGAIFVYVRAPKKGDSKLSKDEVLAKFDDNDAVGVFTRAPGIEKVLRKVLS